MTYKSMARVLAASSLFAGSVLTAGAKEFAGGEVTVNADASVNSGFGLSGTNGGDSLNGLLVAGVAWDQKPSDSRPVTWNAFASVLWVEGKGPTGEFLNDSMAADNSEAYESLRLYEWWGQATAGAWSVRLGALLADAEFCGTTPGGSLINSAFGWPAFISASTLNTGPAFYAAALGSRLAYTGETTTWKLGVYDGDSFDSPSGDNYTNRHGAHYEVNGNQGAFILSELNWAPTNSAFRYQLGGWMHTADFEDKVDTGTFHSGNYGSYATLERTLAGKTGEKGNIEAHVRAGFAPEDRNDFGWTLDTGIAAIGVLPGRDADTLAVGFVHADRATNIDGQDFEQVGELSYTIVLNDHLSLQPDLQYIRHPGSDPTRDNALLLMFRLSASY
jgi:porin